MISQKLQQIRILFYCLICTGLFSSCAGMGQPAEIPEIQPGYLMGYLAGDELPDSLALIPPPPIEGSSAFARDVEIAEASFAFRGTERWELAIRDADLHFPEAAGGFSDVLGFEISREETPYLYMLMRRSLTDAGLSTYSAKVHYQRARPFMVNGEPIGTPDEEDGLRQDGSYPSGHSAIGWGWALILSEIVPEEVDAILARGYEFCESRIICNVHWQSDVENGRMMGAATVARLHADEEFLADLRAAKREVAAIRTASEGG